MVKLRKIAALAALLFTMVFATSSVTFAAPSGAEQEAGEAFTNNLCKVVNLLKGGPAKAIFAIVIIFTAFGAFSGKIQFTTILVIVSGMVVVVSADKIVNVFTDGKTCESV